MKLNKFAASIFTLAVIASVFVFKARAQSGTATMSLNPGTSVVGVGNATTVNLMFNTQSSSAIGFQVVVDFTGTVPSNLAFTPTPPSGFTTSFNQFVNIANGRRLQLIIDTSATTGYSTAGADVSLGYFTFTPTTTGTMTVTFDQAQTAILDSNFADILGTVPNANYGFQANQPSPTPSTSPVATPTPQPASVSMTVRFEGVSLPRSLTVPVNVTYINAQNRTNQLEQLAVPFSNSGNVNGHWTNSTAMNLTPAAGFVPGTYDIFVKGPSHLTKKFSNVQVNSGSNTLNLTSQGFLLTADTNGSDAVDSSDYSAMINQFGCKTNVTPAGKNCSTSGGTYAADVDWDVDVDIYDYSFLVGNYTLAGDVVQ